MLIEGTTELKRTNGFCLIDIKSRLGLNRHRHNTKTVINDSNISRILRDNLSKVRVKVQRDLRDGQLSLTVDEGNTADGNVEEVEAPEQNIVRRAPS